MNYQYHNSIIGVGVVFLLSLAVCLRLPFLANIGIFVLGIGATVMLGLFILDLSGMSDKKPEVLERNKKLNLSPPDTAKVHQVVTAICTLMVAARGGSYFLLAALMAFAFICGGVWAHEVRKLQGATDGQT